MLKILWEHLNDPKVYLFIQVLLVIGLPLIFWRLVPGGRLFPLAIIQIFIGILLGPTILGKLLPLDVYRVLFGQIPDPSTINIENLNAQTLKDLALIGKIRGGIETLGNIATVLFIFLAGCEADKQIVRRAAGTVLRIGITGVVVPMVLGALTLWLAFKLQLINPEAGVRGANGNDYLVAISFGLCMAVTALPVLVIVLRDLGYNQKPIGSIAIALGGVDDAILWLALALLLPISAAVAASAAAGAAGISALSTLEGFGLAILGGVSCLLLLLYVAWPLLDWLLRKEVPEHLVISIAILVLFVSATLTQLTGLHAALGAFLAGLLIPDNLRHSVQNKFDVPVSLLLLPFLFLATGLKVKFSFSGDPTVWYLLVLALVVCVGGKFVGVTVPAYLSGQSAPFSITLGALMQCKGLMEIVVVTILHEQKIIGDALFSALILTALISTAMTAPIARLCEHIFGDRATSTREEDKVAVSVAEPVPEAVPAPVPARAPAPAEIPVVPAPPTAPALPTLMFDHDIGPVPMPKPDIQIGRHSEDEIRIDDVRVSRHHARLTAIGDGKFELYNQTAVRSEPNPILVNGVEKERTVLQDGDVVTIGGVNFTFRDKPAAT
jgi:Kef-type K+ transport system membrane component KefB